MGTVLVAGAVMGAVSALAVGTAALSSDGHGSDGHGTAPAQAAHRSAEPGERRVVGSGRAPTTRSEECDVSAAADGRPLTKDAAIRAARQIAHPVQVAYDAGSEVPDLASYPAAASLLTFATADRWMPGSAEDSLVAPTRCVWMVTVDAPFQPRSTPENGMDVSFDGYTVLFDAASGAYLGVSAGTETPNLITGRNVGADN
jgi:hypothetical protein